MHRYINISLYSYRSMMNLNEKKLRRVILLGNSYAVTLPRDWVERSYVWLEKKDRMILIRPAEVE